MRKYLFELEIEEGQDEFWEEIQNKSSTGCEEVVNLIEELLWEGGLVTKGENKNCELNLVRYSNKG